MAKNPAFLFYSQDFIVGVQTLSFEDRGKYITLLCQMHQQGRLDEETICFLVGLPSVKLKAKFSIDEDGFWYNERLEEEVKKRNNFTESRRNNGLQGGRPKEPIGKHMVNHMGNENYILHTKEYYRCEIEKNSTSPHIEGYKQFANYLFVSSPFKEPLIQILKIRDQLSYEQYIKLLSKVGFNYTKIIDYLAIMSNNDKYTKGKKSIFLTINTWINNDAKKS